MNRQNKKIEEKDNYEKDFWMEKIKSYDFTQLANEIHTNAVTHGWWNWWKGKRTYSDIFASFVKELSEALEEYRFDGNKLNTLVGISGSFLGALLASLSILLALPIDGTFKNLLNKYGHLKRLYIQIAFGSIFYMLSIVFWVFSSQNLFNSLSVIMFIQGLFHTLITFSTLIIILIENSRIIKSV